MDITFLYKITLLLVAFLFSTYLLKTIELSRSQFRGLLLTVMSLFVYSGVGVLYSDVGLIHLNFFIVFLLFFLFALKLFVPFFSRHFSSGHSVSDDFAYFIDIRTLKVLFLIYVFVVIFPLLYPNFRLDLILNPPYPDLKSVFSSRFDGEDSDLIGSLISICKVLIFPFVLIFFKRMNYKPYVVFIFLVLFAYAQYVDQAYLAKALIFSVLLIPLLATFLFGEKINIAAIVSIILIAPLFMFFASFYNAVRLDHEFQYFNAFDAILDILEIEILQVRDVALPLYESNKTIDLYKYFLWLITLPFPKFIIGAIDGSRINYEISTLVLGLQQGAQGWFVVLPAIVGESLYIYGYYFFWIHAIFFGVVVSFFVSFARNFSCTYLYAYFIFMLSYYFIKGGVSSAFPPLINGSLLLAMYFFKFNLKNKIR